MVRPQVRTIPAGVTLSRKGGAYVSLSLSNRRSTSETWLRQTFEWTKSSFLSFDVVIGDYFHRHNLEDLGGLTADGAFVRAVSDGLRVAKDVRRGLDGLSLVSARVRMATDICAVPAFSALLAELAALAASSDAFLKWLNAGTDSFLSRLAPARLDVEEARAHSRSYQLEELAMFELLVDSGYNINVYPGAHLPVMRELVDGSLQGLRPKLRTVRLVELHFRST